MRVAMLSKALVVGAYQKKAEELARLPGVELTVIVPPFWKEGRIINLERNHVSGYDLAVTPMALNGHFHLHFYPALGALLDRIRPDVFHVDEEPYNLATAHAITLGKRRGARTLFFTWQNLCRWLPPPFRFIEQYNYRQADYALAGNQESVEVLRRKGFGGPIAVIPQFGVDPDIYSPQGHPAGGFTIGYLGRFIASKGLASLLEAAAGLDGDWRLLLVGDGPMRAELEERVRTLGIEAHVEMRRAVPSGAVPKLMAELDALVLPSLTTPSWKEQFGRVLVEAMACEVPVVGSDSGEIPNVIGDGGLVFPEGDAAALRERLARLRSDAALKASLARAGRARVLGHYTQAQVAADTYRVFQAMLDQRPVRSVR